MLLAPPRRSCRSRFVVGCGKHVIASGLFALAAASGPWAGEARAQVTVPPSAEPGRIEQRFERPATPQSKPAIVFPPPEQAPPPERAGQIHFVLSGIVLEGNTVLTDADLKPLWQELLGREISLADLYKVRDAITARYRNLGYILSQAVIPAQKINGNGLVRIQIVEGAINRIRFEGEASDRFGLLDDYAARIRASRPLHISVYERYALLIDDLPGITARTVLEPTAGKEAGSDLTVILERKPLDASLTVDNRGTRSAGPLQVDSGVTLNDVIGVFDQTALRGIVTPQIEELRYLDLTHLEQIGMDGTTLTLGARRSWSEPGYTSRQFAIKSQSSTLRAGVSHPVIRSRSETLRLSGDLTYRNSRTNAVGDKLSDDRVRFVSLSGSYDIADAWQGSNLFQLGLHKGLDLLNATDNDEPGQSRLGAAANFTKWTFSAERNQPLPERFGVVIGVEGQFSDRPLLSSEEFGVGGKLFGRAFDSSEITGDKGASAKVELQYTPDVAIPSLNYIQLFTYYDYGVVWNYEDGTRHGRQSLASAGAGVRFGLLDQLSGTLEFGRPMIRDASATGDRDVRGFFTLTARY